MSAGLGLLARRVEHLAAAVAVIREAREAEADAAEFAAMSTVALRALYREADPDPDVALPAGLAGLSTARLAVHYRDL